MSGWAWFLIALVLLRVFGPPVVVGKPRDPLSGSVAAVLVGLSLVEMYAVLHLAGVL